MQEVMATTKQIRWDREAVGADANQSPAQPADVNPRSAPQETQPHLDDACDDAYADDSFDVNYEHRDPPLPSSVQATGKLVPDRPDRRRSVRRSRRQHAGSTGSIYTRSSGLNLVCALSGTHRRVYMLHLRTPWPARTVSAVLQRLP
jgi:hypothetical protein